MKYMLLMVLSVLCLFENTALGNVGGVYTASFSFLLIPFIVLILIFDLIKNQFNRGQKILFFGFLFSIIYSFLFLFLFAGEYYIAFFLDRGIRLILIASNVVFVSMFLLKCESEIIEKSFLVIGISVLIILGINLVAPSVVNNTSILQGTPAFSPHRLRGFTLEASTFGFQLCIGLLMLCYYFRLSLSYTIPILVSILLLTTSKGALTTFMLATAFALVINFDNKVLKIAIGVFCIIAGGIVFQSLLQDQFATDIEKYNSVSTRGTMILTSVWTLVTHPLGMGYFGYFDAVYTNGPKVMNAISSLFPRVFNFHEVSNYFIFGTIKSVSTKTLLFDWVIFFGMFTVVLGYKFCSFTIKKAKSIDLVLLIMLLFIFMSISLYVPLDRAHIALFPIIYVINFKTSHFRNGNNERTNY
jgi:hypothetical protein